MIAQLAALIGQPCLVAGKGTEPAATRGAVTDVKLSYGVARVEVERETIQHAGRWPNAVQTIATSRAWVEASRVYLIEADGTTLRPCVTA